METGSDFVWWWTHYGPCSAKGFFIKWMLCLKWIQRGSQKNVKSQSSHWSFLPQSFFHQHFWHGLKRLRVTQTWWVKMESTTAFSFKFTSFWQQCQWSGMEVLWLQSIVKCLLHFSCFTHFIASQIHLLKSWSACDQNHSGQEQNMKSCRLIRIMSFSSATFLTQV